VKRGEGNTNLPELSLLKILPLAYHHSHFLAATLDFTSFFTMVFLGRTLFLQLGCLGLDNTHYLLNFANVMLRIPHTVFPSVLAPSKRFVSI